MVGDKDIVTIDGLHFVKLKGPLALVFKSVSGSESSPVLIVNSTIISHRALI